MGRERYHRWSRSDDDVLRRLRSQGRSLTEIAKDTGWEFNQVKNRIQSLKDAPLGDRPTAKEEPGPDTETKTLEGSVGVRITSLEQLLEVAQVDLAEWEVERYVVNKWEVGSKGPNGEIATEPLFQVKAWLRRIAGTQLARVVEQIEERLSREGASRIRLTPLRPANMQPTERHMLEVCLFDLHIGKLAWAPEVGENYDTRIAEKVARAAVEDLLWQSERYPLDAILFPFGNDYFHVDSIAGLTTAGTPQDRDTRFHKMFDAGVELASWMIDLLATRAPVTVLVVPGNHDETTAFTAGRVIASEFKRDTRVTVDASPASRKYRRYGANLLGFCHGKDEPLEQLAQTMAHEQRAAWAETSYWEWHIGHRHRPKQRERLPLQSFKGVRVRELASLSGTDAYHYKHTYIGEPKEAEAFVWRFSGGLRANLFTQADPSLYRTPEAA